MVYLSINTAMMLTAVAPCLRLMAACWQHVDREIRYQSLISWRTPQAQGYGLSSQGCSPVHLTQTRFPPPW